MPLNQDKQLMKKHFLTFVSVFKNENNYFREWLEYHLMMGVDHFYLYDQDGGLDAMELLRPYEKVGIVTRHPWTHFDGTKYDKTTKFYERDKSHIAFAHCAKNYRHEAQWIQKIDIDEFLVPNDRGNNLTDWLKEQDLNKIKGARTYRYNFGYNGHLNKPEGLVTQNFLKREAEYSDYKDICNTDFITENRYKYNSHKWSYKLFKKGKFIDDKNQAGFHINHYYTKSFEEYKNRQNVMRSRNNSQEGFEKMNGHINVVKDTWMLKHANSLRDRLRD
tara:strand:- start:247 stop:1074 length:828 start_codon:yes stop_codon:yes gene_type:complete